MFIPVKKKIQTHIHRKLTINRESALYIFTTVGIRPHIYTVAIGRPFYLSYPPLVPSRHILANLDISILPKIPVYSNLHRCGNINDQYSSTPQFIDTPYKRLFAQSPCIYLHGDAHYKTIFHNLLFACSSRPRRKYRRIDIGY